MTEQYGINDDLRRAIGRLQDEVADLRRELGYTQRDVNDNARKIGDVEHSIWQMNR